MSCSFCNSRYHNISHCDNPMIDMLHERIKVIYLDIVINYPNDKEVGFKSALSIRFNARELRAVGVKYLNAVARTTKVVLINMLWQYFSSRISYLPEPQENDGWIEAPRLHVEPNTVPNLDSDLEDTPPEYEHDITWYIDTTPSPISVLEIFSGNSSQVAVGRNLLPEFNAVAHTSQVKKYNISPLLVQQQEKEGVEECAICYEFKSTIVLVKLNCSHVFCGECIKGTLKAHNNMYCSPTCALCRAPITSFSVKNPEIFNLVSEYCL